MTVTTPHRVEFISDRLAQWAQAKPDEEAISYGDRQWSWAELHERVTRVAGGLAGLGLGRGDRVAFLDKNNPACLEVSFGAGLLGAVNAVVNWRLAGDELDYVINDSGATVLFVGAELLPAIEAIRAKLSNVEQVVVVGGDDDGYEAFVAGAEPAERLPEVSPDDLWLVMYSSGTTGRPKGVMLSHRNIVTHTENVGPALPFESGDRNLVAMPLFHVGGTCYALFGIHAGVPSTMTREPDPASLFAAFAAGVTHAFLVPAVISAVFAAGEKAVAALSGLKYLIYGAAPMPLPLLRKALSAWPRMNLIQVYGQTELAGVITTLDPAAHRDDARPERLASAGTLVPGAEMRVVDPATGHDVAGGEAGELWFRSPQRMLGYLNRPEATAETIVEDGWLRTGDIGHVDDGGFVFVSDRIRDMIITGGENVYSPEVEQALAAHPAVAEVAVIGVPDDHWGESIKAYVALLPGQTAEADELLAFTRERLAGYKCPRTVELIEALPRNPSGKILKRELRKPFWEGRERQV
ncbi:MAG: long-chain-fatty-acid--CoA ligase [Actinophytocola sp.]|nr:long-chain-fatty-acid--CoA ligase [Actinophytocola sp.]